MKTLIIVKSIHRNNTAKIADRIGLELNADIIEPNMYKDILLDDYEVIGFGSGIYMQKHHNSLLRLAKSLPNSNKKVFIFSTSGTGFFGNIYHYPLRKLLCKKGYNIIGEYTCKGFNQFGPFALVGGINKGRPNNNDLEKAVSFANSLKQNS